MSNTLDKFNPIFYVNEAFPHLMKALGMAGRVFRGFDDANTSRTKGDTISVKIPAEFVAQDAPSSAQDMETGSFDVKLDQWKEVKFALTDKELAYTAQEMIDNHIVPACYALADKIDQSLCDLYKDVPWYADWSSPAAVTDITGFRSKMFANKVNLADPSKLHVMVDGDIEGELLALQAFAQFQGGGQAAVETQLRGSLGMRYGFNFFANQNVKSHTSATVADLAGAANGAAAAGAKSLPIDGISAGAVLKAGDIVLVSGHTQQYVLTADVTADGTGAATLAIQGSNFVKNGGLESAVADNTVVTIVLSAGSGGTKYQNLAFHQGAFGLGMAKLPDFYDGEGVRVYSAIDPITGLGLRARTWVDGNNSKYYVAFDTLYGLKTIDANKAIRVRN